MSTKSRVTNTAPARIVCTNISGMTGRVRAGRRHSSAFSEVSLSQKGCSHEEQKLVMLIGLICAARRFAQEFDGPLTKDRNRCTERADRPWHVHSKAPGCFNWEKRLGELSNPVAVRDMGRSPRLVRMPPCEKRGRAKRRAPVADGGAARSAMPRDRSEILLRPGAKSCSTSAAKEGRGIAL